jgi:hypothetical protein
MGDWLNTKNHQETELWLSVQDKCIYQQNNGEWSQFSQLNLGRLRFSKTPRIVPQPNRFSHRIQVMQRTHNHEVAAKVNIFRSSNVGLVNTRLKTPYDPNQPIDTLFQQIQDARAFVVAGGQPYGAAMIVNVADTLVFNTGLFPDACRSWQSRAIAGKRGRSSR